LSIAPSTVKSHLRNLYKKLGAANRAEAVALAAKLGLLASTKS
jgi:LuxR family maltose regulon positive regulatory protein